MGSRHDAPARSVPGDEAPAPMTWQAEVTLLFSENPAGTVGLVPTLNAGKLSGLLPTFSTTTVRGLSLLAVPGAVSEKFKAGGSAKSSFSTRLSNVSAM